MPNTIIMKKSSTASAVPAAGSLQPGELAVNLADRKIYSKTTGGAVILMSDGNATGTVTSVTGTGTVSGLTLSGTVTGSGNLTLGGSLSLTSGNVTTALGFTPANKAGDTFTGAVLSNNDVNVAGSNFAVNTTTKSTALYAYDVQRSGTTVGGITIGGVGVFATGTTVGGNTVLHAGNYNTYSPTLTGTGASGTWGISISGSAATLTTARSITIGNTARTFNGSANISWTTGDIGAEFQHPLGVPRNNLGDPTVREMALFQEQFDNKTLLFPIANVWFESSTDNVNWTNFTVSDTEKRRFLTGDASANISIPYGTPFFRVRLRAQNYVYLNAFYSYWSSNGHSSQVQVFKKHDSGAWTQHTNSTTTVSSWPGHIYLPFSTIAWHPTATLGTHFHEIYVLFIPTWNATYPSNGITLYKGQFWGGYPAGKRNIYSTNELGDVTFPGTITATGFTGNASTATALQTARTINGTSFNGSANITTASWGTSRTLSFTGDATGSAAVDGSANVATALTLANSGVTAGTYTKVTVDAKGRVTSGASLASGDLPTYTGTLTSTQVTTALGFTPYNSTNPAGYITSSGSITGTAANVTGTVAVANGGTGATTAAAARTNLGATTVGGNLFTLTNPSAVTFPRFNADNTVSALDAATFRSAIGAGTGNGTVTSVGGTGTVNGLTLTGTVTGSGNLTLGGTLSGVSLTTQVTGTLPVANGGTGVTTSTGTGSVVLSSGAALTNATIGGNPVGFRNVPLTSTTGLTATTAVLGGAYLATGNITINGSVFAAGDTFSIVNNSSSAISIVQGSGMTLRLVGTGSAGTRTLAQRGIATILFVSAAEAIITGTT